MFLAQPEADYLFFCMLYYLVNFAFHYTFA